MGRGAALALGPALGIRLDEGREVRPRIGEEILDAARGEELEVRFGGALDGRSLEHGELSFARKALAEKRAELSARRRGGQERW